ncbi:short-chain dehydrogenase [Gordoniibacillus kamchatkensis]|uniref:Short-chain dehydrogenase n=1 Tax=Gordoniibacillus kamchatkensis TaxID=1590651 RepID=A0ABR5AMH6_9BACL|nr:SDR family oxidoreductase [Paenibacillus sp. VKM B-2647]KIL42240.1 short-chain dehydrogenase [Paenibacillus sp. VKM B-2647]
MKDSMLSLQGKVAVISGGASGIGFATAKLLAEYGAHAVIVDINEKQGAAAADSLVREGLSASFQHCDITSIRDCEQAVQQTAAAFGRIDILFNNAGVIRRKSVVELEEREWDQVIDISLKGAYLLSKFAIPVMADGGGGTIVNTGSGWGLEGGSRAAAYCAAKAGVVNLTKAMAIDHGPQNIRVNCVCPGDTDTPLLRDEAKQMNMEEAKFMQSSAAGRPLDRIGTPEDIAKAVLFLASDMSSWVTGSVLVVDGGGLAGN